LYFLQITFVMVGHDAYVGWMGFVNFSFLDLMSDLCLDMNATTKLQLAVLAPFFPFFNLPVLMLLHLCLIWIERSTEYFTSRRPGESDNSRTAKLYRRFLEALEHKNISANPRPFLEPYWRTFLNLLLSSYTNITLQALQYTYCIDIAGAYVVYFAPAVSCYSDEYRLGLGLVVAFLLFVIGLGIPLGVWLLLRNRSEDSDSPHSERYAQADYKQKVSFGELWKPWHDGFDKSCRTFYQSAILGRRLIVSIVSTFLVLFPAARYMSFSIVHLAFLLMHLHLQPFDKNRGIAHEAKIPWLGKSFENNVETASLSILTLLGCVLIVYPSPLTAAERGLLLIPVILALVLLAFLVTYVPYLKLKFTDPSPDSHQKPVANDVRPDNCLALDSNISMDSSRPSDGGK